MTDALQRYRVLRARLVAVRASHGDEDSAEEDQVLDEMDDVWWQLSAEEHAVLERE